MSAKTKFQWLSCAVALVTLTLAATSARADALQDRLLLGARAVSGNDFTFTETGSFERTGADKIAYVRHYDPHRKAGQRWRVVEVNGKAPTAKQASQLARESKDQKTPSYANIADWIGGPATRTAATAETVTYQFARLPAGTIKIGGRDISADTSGTAVVNIAGKVPFVERTRFTHNKPFSIMVVAKLSQMVIQASYRQLPDGRVVLASVSSDMTGSLMGKSASMKGRSSYSGFAAAR
jgi:hypothetical protein